MTNSADVLASALSGAAAAFSVKTLLQNVAEAQQAFHKLQAQTGVNATEMGVLSDTVQSLYTDGIGESLGDVADTAALVKQQFRDLDASTLESITKNAAVMADTFGTDVNETLRGVNALMVNMGLSAEEAFNYIAAGTQNGLDKSGELSDNIAEYSQLWAQAGFSAEEMFSILQNGLDSGAYNLDKVNDFVKEFTISLSDGRMEENIESFSDNTQYLFEQWRNGAASQKDVFESVIADLSSMTNEQEALTIASTTWSALGEDNAMRVITSLNQVNDTYTAVEGAMSAINDIRYNDVGSSLEKVGRSAKNLLTETLTPAISTLSDGISDGLDGVTNFAKEHEALASGMTAATVAAGLLTVGLIAVSGAITVVKTAFDALNVSAGGILKVVGLAVAGVSLLVGAFAGLRSAVKDDEVEVEDYNGTLEECRSEIELTESALNDARNRYGENSKIVQSLEKDLDKLNAQYEKGGGYLGELRQKSEDAGEALNVLSQTVEEQNKETENMEISGLKAVSMLETLSKKSEKTNEDLDLMQNYADYLNDTFNCNINVNYDTGELTGFDPSAVYGQIISTADEARKQTAMDYLSDPEFLDSYTSQYEAMMDAQNVLSETQKEFGKTYAKTRKELIDSFGSATYDEVIYQMSLDGDIFDRLEDAEKTVQDTEKAFKETSEEVKSNSDIIDETGKLYRTFSEHLSESSDALEEFYGDSKSVTEAVSDEEEGISKARDTISQYGDQLYELCAAYDEAREAALDSIQGQYDAWDTVEEIGTTSTSSIIEALNSQNDYWKQYNDNLSTLQERSASIEGLGDMLSSMADGSEDSAAALRGLASASDEELQEAVAAWQNLKQNQDDTANNMASVQTQFQTALGQISSDMQSCVQDMDLADGAYAAATSTMNSYIQGINDRIGEVRSALSSLQIAGSQIGVSVTAPASVEANASGTTNASDVFIAGEQGAELIVGMGGSTVFPAAETEKIIRAVSAYADFSGGYTPESSATGNYHSSTVTYAPIFHLTQNGSTSGLNQKQVKRWMQSAMDDVFASVLRTNPPVYEI